MPRWFTEPTRFLVIDPDTDILEEPLVAHVCSASSRNEIRGTAARRRRHRQCDRVPRVAARTITKDTLSR